MSPAGKFGIVLGLGVLAVVATCERDGSAVGEVSAQESKAAYQSPYRIAFAGPPAELLGDLVRTERGEARRESEVPFGEWYSRRTQARWHGWGPSARWYPPPKGLEDWPVERRRERVIAVALRFVGYGYQHHHIPDFDPPTGWPWTPTCAGRNGRGVDCSNFTAFVYNLGFGLKLNGDVHRQAEERFAPGPGAGRETPLHQVPLPSAYAERLKVLRTGDLVFIRGKVGGPITHVVLWVGPIGKAPDGAPLIVDSHGGEVHDSQGRAIPCGIQIRPFHEKSWYNADASHALRVFR